MKKIALVVFIWFLSVAAQAQPTVKTPALDLKDIRGRQVRLADYKGRVLLINFWATWCIPCRTEIPDLVKLQTKYRNRGLSIIGITYPPEELSDVGRFARMLRMNYPVALGIKDTMSQFTSTETLPITVVVDRDGKMRDIIEGIMYQDEFDQKVLPLLSTTAAITSTRSQPQNLRTSSLQKATVEVGADGYKPTSLRLRRSVPAQLTFIRKTEETCGLEIVIPAYGISRPLPLNTPVVVKFTPRRSGRFKFTCGMDMFRGQLIVR